MTAGSQTSALYDALQPVHQQVVSCNDTVVIEALQRRWVAIGYSTLEWRAGNRRHSCRTVAQHAFVIVLVIVQPLAVKRAAVAVLPL